MSTKTRLEPNIISKAPRQKKDGKATARGQKVPAPIGRPGRRKNRLRGVEHPAVGVDVRGSRGEEP